MSESAQADVTQCLQKMQEGDESARERLFDLIYGDLREIAGHVFGGAYAGQTLQPTAVVHEAYLRLVKPGAQEFNDRKHFLRVAATAMRQLITDQARARSRQKRGGGQERVMLEEAEAELMGDKGIDVVVLDEALSDLAALDERHCRVVELRFFVGLTVDETAEVLGVSPRTVAFDWKMAQRFLAERLGGDSTG